MPYPPYEPSREVRLGLVLYGGLSLAIYINGVSREFFRATRGQDVYSLIKGLTDSDIGVDIVSGTSAGGINGIFLGFALCNEREFAGFAKLWRDLGDISKLMRDPSRNPDATKSLLDSEGYYQPSLASGFARLGLVTTNGYGRYALVRILMRANSNSRVEPVSRRWRTSTRHPSTRAGRRRATGSLRRDATAARAQKWERPELRLM
jgi:Patatin-like phospholipase